MSEPMTESVYPLRLEGDLDEPLSRWLWLVKWLLADPALSCSCSCGSRTWC